MVSQRFVVAIESLPHLSPISALITWPAALGESNFDFFFLLLLFSSLIQRMKKTDSSMPGIQLCHAEWHSSCQPYQLTCSLTWPHAIVPC